MERIGIVPEGFLLVTADVVSQYPSIAHKEGILGLKNKLKEETFSKLAEFVLADNVFEFNNKVK